MSLTPSVIESVPEETARMARAAFPKDNLSGFDHSVPSGFCQRLLAGAQMKEMIRYGCLCPSIVVMHAGTTRPH
jgi:hypothetical protein